VFVLSDDSGLTTGRVGVEKHWSFVQACLLMNNEAVPVSAELRSAAKETITLLRAVQDKKLDLFKSLSREGPLCYDERLLASMISGELAARNTTIGGYPMVVSSQRIRRGKTRNCNLLRAPTIRVASGGGDDCE
jgi:hypothetical protein